MERSALKRWYAHLAVDYPAFTPSASQRRRVAAGVGVRRAKFDGKDQKRRSILVSYFTYGSLDLELRPLEIIQRDNVVR